MKNSRNNPQKKLAALLFLQSKLQVLSSRELEYCHLVTFGLADKQVADRMQISVHTANAHRRNIQHKMGFNSKLDIVRWTTHRLIKNYKKVC